VLNSAGLNIRIIDNQKCHGPKVKIVKDLINFGRGQIIFRNENGVLVGAT